MMNPLYSWQKKGREYLIRAGGGGDFFSSNRKLIHSNQPGSLAASKHSAQVTGGNSDSQLISSFAGQQGSSSVPAVLPPTAHRLGSMCHPKPEHSNWLRGWGTGGKALTRQNAEIRSHFLIEFEAPEGAKY